jgi:hypothetical protein
MRDWLIEGLSNLFKYPIKFFMWVMGILIESIMKAVDKAGH